MNLAALIDKLAKADAKNPLPSGGTQYSPEVALGPQASGRNQAMMRSKKMKIAQPIPLRQLMKQCK